MGEDFLAVDAVVEALTLGLMGPTNQLVARGNGKPVGVGLLQL